MEVQKNKVSWTGLTLGLIVLLSPCFAQEIRSAKTITTNKIDSNKNATSFISQEEKLIRLAYKKLAVYNAVAKYRDGKKLQDIINGNNSLRFSLSNFKSGSINEIKNVLYNDATSAPTEEIIQLARSTVQWNSREEQIAYKAQWIPGKYSSGFDRNWTVADILRMETARYFDVERYTSYEVTVFFEGKSRKYRALAIHHGPSENLKLEFWDAVVSMGGGLGQVWEEQRLPFGLNRRSGVQESRIYSTEKFANKINNFLTSGRKIPTQTETGIYCPAEATDLQQCCIDSELAEFWEAPACNGWWTDINTFINSSSDLEIDSDIEFYSSDGQYHIGGGKHHGRARFRPECFSEPDNRQRCNIQIRDQGYGDTDTDHSDIYYHIGNIAESTRGNIGPRGQDVSCDSAVGFAFNRCLFSCGVSLQLSISGNGIGAVANVTGGDLWRTGRAEGNICSLRVAGGCGGELLPGGVCASGFTAVGGICTRTSSFISQCDRFGGYDDYSCGCLGGCFDGSCSPVLIDVLGNGFALTDTANGVNFDVDGNGIAERRAWTTVNTDDAWLVFDRNANGSIDDGKELFGSSTSQPPPPLGIDLNGFNALFEYDKIGFGGNNNGKIDERDSIFLSLKLWQDTNHNGISEVGELHTLTELGVASIDTDYKKSKRVDEYGNEFRYRAKVRNAQGAQVGRWAWDVFLVE